MPPPGQLGLGDQYDRTTPTAQPPLAGGDVVAACAGQFHTLLLTSAGVVYAAGGNAHGQLGTGAAPESLATLPVRVDGALAGLRVSAVACGTAHSLALTDAGEVYSWGAAASGQLGLGGCELAPGGAAAPDCALPAFVGTPTRVPGLPPAKLIAAGGGFAGGAGDPGAPMGAAHSLAVARDTDELWAWVRFRARAQLAM